MTASALLAQYGVTVTEARTFIMSNLGNLSTILSTSKQFGVTNDMLAEIYGGVSGNDVRAFFSSHGLDSANLDTSAIRLVSSSLSGIGGNHNSYSSSISSDGRYVAFESGASNLVSGDTNYSQDIYLKDTQTGIVQLISLSTSGKVGTHVSLDPSISSDGRYIAFESNASNLVSGDTNMTTDIFVKDTQTGVLQLVSSSSSGIIGSSKSYNPSISSDGRYVAFQSNASNLVSGDTNNAYDVFVKDTQTGTLQLISSSSSDIFGNSASGNNLSISSDGRYVTFESNASNLVSGDTNSTTDIFVKDTQTGSIQLISSSSSGIIGSANSLDPSISSDGRYIAFTSLASNIVIGDTINSSDIFIKDTQTGTLQLISSSSSGIIGNSSSQNPSISSDGRYVTFESYASNLVIGDALYSADIFVKDTQTGSIQLISSSSSGIIGSANSLDPTISADGRYIAFNSGATDLISEDINGYIDIFIVGNPLITSAW